MGASIKYLYVAEARWNVDFESAAINLAEMAKTGVVYLRTNLPLIDFTKPFQGTLDIYGEKQVLSIDLSVENELPTIAYLLTTVLDDQVLIIGWNLKELITYFKFHLNNKAEIKFSSKIFDLRLIEAFSGQNLPAPESLKQAIKRMSGFRDNIKAKTIHSKIHKPLLMEVIPSMETQGVLHTDIKRRVYPYYEIETHVNGRLKGSKAFPLSINTHGLTESEKEKLKLRSDEEMFVYFDFNSMEVAMLQYLSGDTALADILATGDCYKNMWTELFNTPCETLSQRRFIKDCFLPVVFGMGNNTIIERTGCSENAAVALSKGLKTRFKQAFEYVTQFQGNTSAEDFFGRRRIFDDAKPHVVRNFVIQAPAAIVCMEKLIDLYHIVGDQLLFSIHDGYVIRCDPKFNKPLIIKCKNILEAPSKLAPGLRLNVNCEIGVRLHKMKQLKI